ncbi:MAG TPA: hypothetical protein VGH42_04485 [Verrucomicrobiae bacterium]|jgi:hypothetical protein
MQLKEAAGKSSGAGILPAKLPLRIKGGFWRNRAGKMPAPLPPVDFSGENFPRKMSGLNFIWYNLDGAAGPRSNSSALQPSTKSKSWLSPSN